MNRIRTIRFALPLAAAVCAFLLLQQSGMPAAFAEPLNTMADNSPPTVFAEPLNTMADNSAPAQAQTMSEPAAMAAMGNPAAETPNVETTDGGPAAVAADGDSKAEPLEAATGYLTVTARTMDGKPIILSGNADECGFWLVDSKEYPAYDHVAAGRFGLSSWDGGNAGPVTDAIRVPAGDYYVNLITPPAGYVLPNDEYIPVTITEENTADNPVNVTVNYLTDPNLADSGPIGIMPMGLSGITGGASGTPIAYLADGTPIWQHAIYPAGVPDASPDGITTFCTQHGSQNPHGTSYTAAGAPPQGKILSALCYLNSDYKIIQGAYWRALGQYSAGKDSAVDAAYDAAVAFVNGEGSTSTPADSEPVFSWTDGEKFAPNKTVTISGTQYFQYGPFKVTGATRGRWATSLLSGWKIGNSSGSTIYDTAKINPDSGDIPATFYVYAPVPGVNGETIRIYGGYNGATTTNRSISDGSLWTTANAQNLAACGSATDDTKTSTKNVYQTIAFSAVFSVSLQKTDSETGAAPQGTGSLEGAVYGLYAAEDGMYAQNELIASAQTDAGGQLKFTDILWGKYYIKEISAPYGYQMNIGSIPIDPNAITDGNYEIQATSPEIIKRFNVDLQKKDSVTGLAVQGDATLAGAAYGLYCAVSNNTYTKDQLVKSAKTDAGGKISFKDILWGQYYIREISASPGYTLNTGSIPINPDTIAAGTGGNYLVSVTGAETVKKQAFELIKGGVTGGQTEMDLLRAGFTAYLISDLAGVRDGSLKMTGGAWTAQDFRVYGFAGEPSAKVDGKTVGEFFSDEKGRLISPELPYGAYIVAETTVPKGRMEISPFLVIVSEDSRQAQPWRLFNDEEIAYYLRIVKKDTQSGNTVLGKTAKYRIYDLDNNDYVTMKTTYPQTVWYGTEENPFATRADGTLVTPEKLRYGHYRLDEVGAPEGYALAGFEQTAAEGYDPEGHTETCPANPVFINLDEATPIYLESAKEDVIEVVQTNERQYGKLSLLKTGEAPDTVETGGDGFPAFRYAEKPLAGAVFELIATEDILAPDGSGTVLCNKDGVAARMTTDENGQAWAGQIPLGAYILRETVTPAGYLPAADRQVTIHPFEQERQIIFLSYRIKDERQRLGIDVFKSAKHGGKPLAGAEFTIFAAEDIPFGPAAQDLGETEGGTPIEDAAARDENSAGAGGMIKKGEIVAKIVSDKDGKASVSDLPPGSYTVRETKAPDGYLLNLLWTPNLTLAHSGAGGPIAVPEILRCADAAGPVTPIKTPAPETPAPETPAPKTADGFLLLPAVLALCLAVTGLFALHFSWRQRKNTY